MTKAKYGLTRPEAATVAALEAWRLNPEGKLRSSRKGGEACLINRGRAHYIRMAGLSRQARQKKQEATANQLARR